jgi:hypothetical protein
MGAVIDLKEAEINLTLNRHAGSKRLFEIGIAELKANFLRGCGKHALSGEKHLRHVT